MATDSGDLQHPVSPLERLVTARSKVYRRDLPEAVITVSRSYRRARTMREGV